MSLSITRKVQPLASLHPYETLWRIKILLTDKGTMCTYSNARGEGCVFNVEFTDDDGTQMKATMFNEAAKKFYNVFEIGKVYYISKGTIKVASKQFRTVDNDLEMILNQNSQVEEAVNESMVKPEKTFNFVPIDQLGLHVNQNNLVDVIGVVQHVSPTMSIRRKITQQIIPKRDIRIVDETKKSVVICLWNEHATSVGQELLEMADKSPIVAMKSLKVGEFQGVSLSTLSNSYIQINPDIPDCLRLKSWFASEGKEVALPSTELCFTPPMNSRSRSMYLDRVTLHYVTTNPSLGEDKPVYFSTRASMTFINPDHTMSYRGCNTCNKKVTESTGKGYWCARCQKNEESFTLRYIMSAKFSDATGEAWFSIFDEQAQILLGCSADELAKMKAQEEGTNFLSQLKKAKWVSFLFRVSVARTEYNNVKRQKINVVDIRPIDFAAESSFMLNEIADDMTIPYDTQGNSKDALIDAIFPSLQTNGGASDYIISRAILSTKNQNVDEINDELIERFYGEEKIYYSFDEAQDDRNNIYPIEFLNSLTVSGLPPHRLRLKIGCPVILLRNIDPTNGLCNGTRLICKGFQQNVIHAEIAVGQHSGKRVFLPRIPLCPSKDGMFPFKLKRKQFPVRLSLL